MAVDQLAVLWISWRCCGTAGGVVGRLAVLWDGWRCCGTAGGVVGQVKHHRRVQLVARVIGWP
jgi:hypothetical protein